MAVRRLARAAEAPISKNSGRHGLWTDANNWFSNEEGKKGVIKAGQLADLAILAGDYMNEFWSALGCSCWMV